MDVTPETLVSNIEDRRKSIRPQEEAVGIDEARKRLEFFAGQMGNVNCVRANAPDELIPAISAFLKS